MKSTITILFAGLLLFSSCRNGEEVELASIEGRWIQDSAFDGDASLSYRNELIFAHDGTYELSIQLIESSSGNLIGYLSLHTGAYTLDKNKLYRVNIKMYGLDNVHDYLDRGDLVFQGSIDELPVISVSLNSSKDALTLDFTQSGGCADVTNCIDYQTFHKGVPD